MKKTIVAVPAVALVLTLGGCDFINNLMHPSPGIKFAPYSATYQSRADFAQVEYEFPLAPADLQKLDPQNLVNYDQEQIDQIYARLTAGLIPDGPYDGGLFFPRGVSGDKRVAEIVGGLPGLAAGLEVKKIELIGKTLWKGKVFYRNERVLRNRIEDLVLLKPLIDGDLSTIPKITVAGKEQWLMFPAKLYCGQSLLDSRRESVIIDYAFTDEIPGYRERPDYLAGRNGFQVRDEIRMVRPGFYLGRAYIGKVFLLNFTLYNKEVADRDGGEFLKTGQSKEDCWPGTQRRATFTAAK
ncbi:MAG TPA: hypothetical protein VHB46_19590 [Burkholderiales bacterium]|nr:hypothetical protein [Burkholderiales bacterium]